jgi:hypothetical protein
MSTPTAPTAPVYRPLGHSGLKVPQLWLGTMMFGDQTNEADSLSIIDATRDAGLNALDTADVYAKGESERIVGRGAGCCRQRTTACAGWTPTGSTCTTCTATTKRCRSRRRCPPWRA